MYITKQALALAQFTGDEVREEINQVYFKDETATATDSYRMARLNIPHTGSSAITSGIEFATAEGMEPADNSPFGITPETMKRVAKIMPDDKQFKDLNLAPVVFLAEREDGEHNPRASFMTRDMQGTTATTGNLVSRKFPDVDALLKIARENETAITLNVDYLIEFLTYIKKHKNKDSPKNGVMLKIADDKSPLYMTAEITDGQTGEFLIMPIKA